LATLGLAAEEGSCELSISLSSGIIMSSSFRAKLLTRNFLANITAQIIPPLLSVALVPIYLRYLGIESFGLIGFLFAFAAALNVFTKGINWALQREVAQRSHGGAQYPNIPNLLRTYEVAFWVLGIILGACIAIFSGFFAENLLQTETLSSSVVAACILLISIRIAVVFPVSIYSGLLVGFERQVLNNAILTSIHIAGSVITVTFVVLYQTVIVFFLVELLQACIGMLVLRYWAYKITKKEYQNKPSVDLAELRRLWRESIHLIGTHGIGAVIKTIDRIILGLLLPLSNVAIYSIGKMGGELLSMVYGSYLSSIFPGTCQAANKNEECIVANIIIHTKIIWALMLAISLPIAIASEDIVAVWTRKPEMVEDAAMIMSVFIFGNLFLAINNVIYQSLVALRRTRQSFIFNIVALFMMVPAIFLLVSNLGAIGAAWVWVAYGVTGWVFSFILIAPLFTRKQVIDYFRAIVVGALVATILAIGQHFISSHFLAGYLLMRLLLAALLFLVIIIFIMLIEFGYDGFISQRRLYMQAKKNVHEIRNKK